MMTAQIMNEVTYRDLDWALCEMENYSSIIPDNTELGFETESDSTANYTGRVDFLLIDRQNRLKLHKVMVNLIDEYKEYIPGESVGYRQEIKTIRKIEIGKKSGQIEESTLVFIHYNDLRLNYSGPMVIGRQFDNSLYQHLGYQTANRFRHRIYLEFKDGVVLRDKTREERGSYKDT